eukprot:CAMPEP_0196805074 /NCGR_PEP_ID=MMETSP1362-20130617/4798_1 /TAXON_ID=163516 /ORGANISM="Leptocylindrus danicus, Strain CCMP1856" /LENGTH=637 /DNA_ID=CAMNT_0042177751 /DNA_START=86 /DNA_END=1999 /DNA_ORIENTATION=+
MDTPMSTRQKKIRSLASVVPLRLSPRERSLLAVLEATLNVSEYTDNIDISSRRNKAKRILDGILEACAIGTGLAIVANQNEYVFHEANGNAGKKNGGLLKLPSFRRSSKLKKSSTAVATASTSTSTSTATAISNTTHTASSNSRERPTSSASEAETDVSVSTANTNSNNTVTDEIEKEQAPATATATATSANTVLHNSNPTKKATTTMTTTTTKANLATRSPEENAEFFQEVFEIGRRNKVLNPSKMRSTYGKLMYMLQDSQSPSVAKGLGFCLYKEMLMVGPHLAEMQIEELLSDARLLDATMHVSDLDEKSGKKIGREEVQKLVRRKRDMQQELIHEYGRKGLATEEEVQRCIDSLADAVSVIESNVAPVRRMLSFLEDNFDPMKAEPEFSLKLSSSSFISPSRSSGSAFSSYNSMNRFGFGSGGDSSGPTLSHNHPTQYTFVRQSLKLWCKVQENMHRLWVCADDDLLSTTHGYSLWNTGQGLNRVQTCPRVAKVMHTLLGETRTESSAAWVGLSVVHLGDRDVPNALIFIDKYTQIPRFLQPIVSFIDSIPKLCEDQHVADYIEDEFGGERRLKMYVLKDYFKHGFDGSGDDGGSCIDGRLTSSWNWTSQVAKKRYYNILMMSGFQGFDGDFK